MSLATFREGKRKGGNEPEPVMRNAVSSSLTNLKLVIGTCAGEPFAKRLILCEFSQS